MSTQTKRTPEEFAKNMPVVGDGFFGPVSITSIGSADGRVIANLPVRTAKSGARNASISWPASFREATQFKKGDLVNFIVNDGYIKALKPAVAQTINTKVAVSMPSDEALAAQHELEKEAVATTSDDELPFN